MKTVIDFLKILSRSLIDFSNLALRKLSFATECGIAIRLSQLLIVCVNQPFKDFKRPIRTFLESPTFIKKNKASLSNDIVEFVWINSINRNVTMPLLLLISVTICYFLRTASVSFHGFCLTNYINEFACFLYIKIPLP